MLKILKTLFVPVAVLKVAFAVDDAIQRRAWRRRAASEPSPVIINRSRRTMRTETGGFRVGSVDAVLFEIGRIVSWGLWSLEAVERPPADDRPRRIAVQARRALSFYERYVAKKHSLYHPLMLVASRRLSESERGNDPRALRDVGVRYELSHVAVDTLLEAIDGNVGHSSPPALHELATKIHRVLGVSVGHHEYVGR